MGFIAAFVVALAGSAKDLTSKSLAFRVTPEISTFSSFLFPLPFYLLLLPIAIYLGYEQPNVGWYFAGLVLLRSMTDAVAEGFKMKAFAFGDVSLVSNFLCLSPIFLLVVSPSITGDIVKRHEVFAVLLALCATLLLIRRKNSGTRVHQGKAILYACGAALAFALNSCFDRLAAVSSGAITSAFAMTGVAALFTYSPIRRCSDVSTEMAKNYPRFLLRGVFETVFMVSKLIALSSLPAHVVSSISGGSLILSVAFGGLWFRETDIRRRLLAALVIYGAVVLILL